MWQKGQKWRVVKSLDLLNAQVRAYAPRSVPPATSVYAWGSIADSAHSTSSDHYPHYYSALGPVAVVCARDFPHAPKLGLDAGLITEKLRLSRDPRIQYIIFNRRITGPNYNWQWSKYNGSDPHDTHWHISSVRNAKADGTQPWAIPGAGTPVAKILQEVQMQMLVRFGDAEDPNQVWLCDGMFRRPISADMLVPVGNTQTHASTYLGNLGNGGNVFVSGGNPDVWGINVLTIGAEGTVQVYEPAQLKQFAKDGAIAAQKEIASAVTGL